MNATAWDPVLGYNVRYRLGKMIIKAKHNPAQFLSGNLKGKKVLNKTR